MGTWYQNSPGISYSTSFWFFGFHRSRELLASQDGLDGDEVDLEGPFFQM